MQKCNENAANRYSYVGEVYNIGEKKFKSDVLNSLKPEWKKLHEEGYIHIHDLDAYGLTYNCLTFNILEDFPYEQFANYSEQRKIVGYFDYLKNLFTDMGNEQSGGMALANYDVDTAKIFARLKVDIMQNRKLLSACTADLIEWCNNTHTRMGQTSYYVTLNIGLAWTDNARAIAHILLDEFEKSGDLIFKPNIVFKVRKGVNAEKGDPNYDLFRKALLCTAKKMIPTYLLCDSAANSDIDPEDLAVMGCRTRVAANVFGKTSSIGRGNIANISINLPRLALEVISDGCYAADDELILFAFLDKLKRVMDTTKDILLDRFNKVCSRTLDDFPINKRHNLWLKKFDDVKEVLKNGTLSIGFIGLSEAVEVITGGRFYEDMEAFFDARFIVRYMREYCDARRAEYNLNFSLLATSGELISGRFIEIDKQRFENKFGIFDKGFYTNSFHVNVDSGLSAFRKIQFEGPFHKMCNGGCITYVEINEAPIGNDEGLRELIDCGVKMGTHYLGFNFPKDVCNKCGASGVFDKCPACGSEDITRIRRVSGYLEVLDGFTAGKKNEVKTRKEN